MTNQLQGLGFIKNTDPNLQDQIVNLESSLMKLFSVSNINVNQEEIYINTKNKELGDLYTFTSGENFVLVTFDQNKKVKNIIPIKGKDEDEKMKKIPLIITFLKKQSEFTKKLIGAGFMNSDSETKEKK